MTAIRRSRLPFLRVAALCLAPAALVVACAPAEGPDAHDTEELASGSESEDGATGQPPTGGALGVDRPPLPGGGCDDDPCTNDWFDEAGNCQSAPVDCDDGIGCTFDSCSPEGECVHDPNESYCGEVADCASVVCSAEPPKGDPQDIAQVGGPDSGCWATLDHDWCTADWDGCGCNGTERCQAQPTSFGDQSGCVPAQTRDMWPCDQSDVGDQNGCTEENCCEEWNPDGCRIHRDAELATPDGEEPVLKLFCDKVMESGEYVDVTTATGEAFCPAGDGTYMLATGNAILDELAGIQKPAGYWCEDCNPCSANGCDAPSGICEFKDVLDGNQVHPPKDEFTEIYWNAVCTSPSHRISCDEDSVNRGCGREECWDGTCRAGPNPKNEDPSKSEECHGFPVFPLDAPETCFELGCDNVGSEEWPNWACVPAPIHELCEDGLFCDGPPVCSVDAFCPGCSAAFAGSVLAGLDKVSDPPLAGSHLQGCADMTADVLCDDWIGCTLDRCDEVNDTCSNHPNDRYCSPHPQDWDPCHPQAQCLGEEDDLACAPSDNPCLLDGEKDCERSCESVGTARQCVAKTGECETECYQEGYYELELAKLEDLCPFMPTMPPGMDREYAGNGPEVDITVDLSISADKHDVLATVRIEARETMGGDTLLQHEFAPIVVASSFREIQYIVSDTTGRARGHSNDGGTWGIACGGCGIVNFYSLEGVITHADARGDTPNDDISHDAACSDEVLIHTLELGNIEVFTRSDCESPI